MYILRSIGTLTEALTCKSNDTLCQIWLQLSLAFDRGEINLCIFSISLWSPLGEECSLWFEISPIAKVQKLPPQQYCNTCELTKLIQSSTLGIRSILAN